MPTRHLSTPPVPVKEEPCDEDPLPKPAQTKGPPGFPRDISVAELLQRLSLSAEEELLFLQLPDTLPGQPPTQDTKPIKTELQNEEGQVVVVKQEKSQVGSSMRGQWGGMGDSLVMFPHPVPRYPSAGGEAGGEYLHPGRPPRGAGGETAHPQVGEGAAGAGQGDPGRDHGDPLFLSAGMGAEEGGAGDPICGAAPQDSPLGVPAGVMLAPGKMALGQPVPVTVVGKDPHCSCPQGVGSRGAHLLQA